MIPLSLIKQFASQDKTRPALLEPVVIDGRVVATNGRVLVEVPQREVDLSFSEETTAPDDFPDYRGVLSEVFGRDLTAVNFKVIGESKDYMQTTLCSACNGTGQFSQPADCEWCDGEGKWEHCEWQLTFPGGSWVNGRFCEMIETLPNLVWYAPNFIGEKIPFTFGSRGRGVLMPMRKTPSHG
jgi:hypothetical protein